MRSGFVLLILSTFLLVSLFSRATQGWKDDVIVRPVSYSFDSHKTLLDREVKVENQRPSESSSTHDNDDALVSPPPLPTKNPLTPGDRKLKSIVESRKDKSSNSIIPIFTNLGWVDLAWNMALQLERVGVKNFFVYAFDQDTCNFISANVKKQSAWIECFYNEEAAAELGDFSKDAQDWGTVGYFQMIDQRLPFVLDMMKKTNVSVFMIDSDVIIKSNPFLGVPKENPYDLIYQEEVPEASFGDKVPTLNGGCWFAKNNPRVVEWLEMSIQRMKATKEPDQDAMNSALRQMILRNATGQVIMVASFPRDTFPNGFVYFVMRFHQRYPDARPPILIHSNWISGKDSKIVRMMDEGAWLLPYDPRPKTVLKLEPPKAVEEDTSFNFKRMGIVLTYERETHNIMNDFSLDSELDAIRKLLHASLYLGSSIALPKMHCYRGKTAACDIDILIDYPSVVNSFPVYPHSFVGGAHSPSNTKNTNIQLKSRKVYNITYSELSKMSPTMLERADASGDVFIIINPFEAPYDTVKRSMPLSDEDIMRLNNILVFSGLISNELSTTSGYLSHKPYFCVQNDAKLNNHLQLIETIKSDISPLKTTEIDLYLVHANTSTSPGDWPTVFAMKRAWGGGFFDAWSVLWYGMRELDQHVASAYVQMLACSRAQKVYVNVDRKTNSWFSDNVCKRRHEKSPCVFY